MQEKAIPTICGFCQNNCGIIAYVRDGVLQRVKGDPNHPATKGDLCPKGMAAKQVVYAPDRLKHPLRRTNNGFQQISWQEALDIISTRLLEIREKYGAETLLRCYGAPVNEAARDGFAQLLASYGSPNSTDAGHICHGPRQIAVGSVYGGMTQADYRNTKLVLLWGANPTDSRRVGGGGGSAAAYGGFSRLIQDVKNSGAKLIIIDPRRISLVGIADKWLAIEPGRDDALALAMLNVIIKEKLYNRDFVENWTTGFDQLAEHVERYTPEWAQDITKLQANEIREVAEAYATTKPAIIREGNAIDQYPNAVQTARAIGSLCAITGNLDVEGGNVFLPNPTLSPLITQQLKAKRFSADKYPLFPRIPFPCFVDAVLTGEPYTPRAMIVHHANPALINANSNKTREALQKLEFLVACDMFMSATAQLADIVLPEASIFERYGIGCYSGTGGGFITLNRKVISPLYDTLPAFEIEYELAKRMGLDSTYPWTNTEGWIDHRLKASGVTLEMLKEQHVIYTTSPVEYRKYLKDGFNTASGKVELYSKTFKDFGYSPLPEYRELETAFNDKPELLDEYPLIGTTRRPGAYIHTRFRNIPMLRRMEPEPAVRICPADAQRLDVNDGDLVSVKSPKGAIRVKAKITDEVSPGIVIIDFGWGNPGNDGTNVNTLTSDEERDPISCSTPNRRFRCQITKIRC